MSVPPPPMELFINLRVLGKIRAHDRLDTSGPTFRIYTAGFVPLFLYRWWHRSSRERDIARIEEVYDSAFKIFEDDERDTHRIQREMELSVSGLRSLCTTYEDDATVVARLEMLVDRIESLTD